MLPGLLPSLVYCESCCCESGCSNLSPRPSFTSLGFGPRSGVAGSCQLLGEVVSCADFRAQLSHVGMGSGPRAPLPGRQSPPRLRWDHPLLCKSAPVSDSTCAPVCRLSVCVTWHLAHPPLSLSPVGRAQGPSDAVPDGWVQANGCVSAAGRGLQVRGSYPASSLCGESSFYPAPHSVLFSLHFMPRCSGQRVPTSAPGARNSGHVLDSWGSE